MVYFYGETMVYLRLSVSMTVHDMKTPNTNKVLRKKMNPKQN